MLKFPYNAHVPGLPQGWKVIHLHRSARHTRDGVVLCERVRESSDSEFVVWTVNFVEGGCFHGFYRSDYDIAKTHYASLVAGLN
jgi:hypothetical protein